MNVETRFSREISQTVTKHNLGWWWVLSKSIRSTLALPEGCRHFSIALKIKIIYYHGIVAPS